METSRPRVACVMTVLDGARHIAEAIDSVRSQTFEDWELVVVDDGSTDDTRDIVGRYARLDERIRLLRHPRGANEGKSISRNLGIRSSDAPVVALLDADDVWLPGKLARQVAILDAVPDVDLVYAPVIYHYRWTDRVADQDRDFVARIAVPCDRPLAPPRALVRMLLAEGGRHESQWPYPSATVFRRSLFDKVGGFEPDFPRLYDDTVFFGKALALAVIWADSEPAARYRLHPGEAMSISYEQAAQMGAEIRDRSERQFIERLKTYLVAQRVLSPALHVALLRNDLRYSGPRLLVVAEQAAALLRMAKRGVGHVFGRTLQQQPKPGRVNWGDLGRPISPPHDINGRGGSLAEARFDAFVARFRTDLRGSVAEVGDDLMLRRYGGESAERTVLPAASGADAETSKDRGFNCILVTDALRSAPCPVRALQAMADRLETGGILLASLPAIASVVVGANDYWRFTEAGTRLLFDQTDGIVITHLDARGSLRQATAVLHGLGAADVPESPDAEAGLAPTILVRAIKT